jgi:hypothetical protein
MVLILLNTLVLFGLFTSNNFGRELLNTVSGSFSRITQDTHQGLDVTSDDQSHTTLPLVREGGHPPPEMGCSHTQVKPTAKRDGSAFPSIEVKAVAIR